MDREAAILEGVTTSRATIGGRRKDQNTSGQWENKFNNSYRDISVIVAENNSVVMPKYQQYTSLNKMVSKTETLIGMDKTWGRPWSTLWPTLWPSICIWPTGGQIFKNIKIKSARVEQVR